MSRPTMRAYVLTAPGEGKVQEVAAPTAAIGEVVVDVERVGVCGTDVEFFTGEMAYLHSGHASYPLRLGHEWAGTVTSVGGSVDPAWVGRRVTGDTMLGDGTCRRCRRGHQHVCEHRTEVGVRHGRPGALAEQLTVPVTSLHALPETVDATLGALVEPGGNAWRAAQAAAVTVGDRTLVVGPGTIGLLTAMFVRARGSEVHLMGVSQESLAFALTLGFEHTWTGSTLPDLPFDAVIDASNAAHLPAYMKGIPCPFLLPSPTQRGSDGAHRGHRRGASAQDRSRRPKSHHALTATARTPDGLTTRLVNRQGPEDRDPVEAVLDEIREDPAVRRRCPAAERLSRVHPGVRDARNRWHSSRLRSPLRQLSPEQLTSSLLFRSSWTNEPGLGWPLP